MANCPPFNIPSPLAQCFTMPCYPPCPPTINSHLVNGVSKLADFTHYGGGGRGGLETSCCPADLETLPLARRNCYESRSQQTAPTRQCPPLPPCPKNYNFSNCKDLPAQRLKNVDILEELCYYVPGSDPNGAMDCYTVDCCGNVEKIEDGCCGGGGDDKNTLQPVKYSRRQRFSFKEDSNHAHSGCPEPWPFNGGGCCEDPCGGGGKAGKGKDFRRQTCIVDKDGPNNIGNPCCGGGRKYTYCPEEPIDCSEMLPPESGVYYFDRERRAFVPEKELPKAPEVIEKQVKVPDVEEYELMAEGDCCEPSCPSVQPVIQPIILPTGGQSCAPPCGPCSYPPCPPPPCPPPQYYPPFPCMPPPCPPPQCAPPCNPCNPPPCAPCNPCCNPPPCNPCNTQCNPCRPCNPCNTQCNPCRPCNPCNTSCNPCCNPCNSSCNPCKPACNPCPPCNPCMPSCNPCMPCGPMNPFMNMCGGVLPMVIPMCPQQPAGGGGMPPPPPFPFPSSLFGKKGKKTKSSKSKSTYASGTGTTGAETTEDYPDESSTTTTDNIIVPGAPEDLLAELGEEIPAGAYPVDMGNNIQMQGQAEYPKPRGGSKKNSAPPPSQKPGSSKQAAKK